MANVPRGASLRLLLNELTLAKRRADGLGLKIVAGLIALAVISVGAIASRADEDPSYLNDNQNCGPSSKD
jgi:hypothetical protein